MLGSQCDLLVSASGAWHPVCHVLGVWALSPWYMAWAAWNGASSCFILCVAGVAHCSPALVTRVIGPLFLQQTYHHLPRNIHLGAAYKACFLRLALLSCREGSLWNLLVAREWMVPICYFDFLAECVSSYQVRNCQCEDLTSMLGAPVSRSGCLVSIGAYVCMGR